MGRDGIGFGRKGYILDRGRRDEVFNRQRGRRSEWQRRRWSRFYIPVA